jgi:glycosyltransferase involved in cell wall biosynthesis
MKITVITPTYNRADFLEETIESVLCQTHGDVEYIVLDDGSTDNTEIVVAPYFGRLRYERHPNMGETRTVNKGYAMATGDAVVVVNSDDPLHRVDALEMLAQCLNNTPDALAVYPDYVYIDRQGGIIRVQSQIDFTIENIVETFNITLGPGMCIRAKALKAVGLRNESLYYTGDVDLSIRLAALGSLAHIPVPLATHRIHPEAASCSAQGEVMAHEVVRLMQLALSSPFFDNKSTAYKKERLANAHSAAKFYCGNSTLARWVHCTYAELLTKDQSCLDSVSAPSAKEATIKYFYYHFHTYLESLGIKNTHFYSMLRRCKRFIMN